MKVTLKKVKGVPGLWVRGGAWYYDVNINGQRYTDTIGDVETISKKDAIKALEVFRGQKQDARLAQDFGIGKRSAGPTVEQYITETYLPWHRDHRSQRSTGGRYLLQKFAAQYGSRRVTSIAQKDVEHFVAGCGGEAATKNYNLGVLAALFAHAAKERVVVANPVSGIERPTPAEKVYRLLRPEEESCLFSFFEMEPFRSLYRVTFWCGFRRGEALSLRVRDVDFEAGRVAIVQQKTNKAKFTPLRPEALAALKDAIRPDAQPDDYIFTLPGKKTPISFTTWGKRFREACDHCGLPQDFTPHSLRHTLACRLAKEGVALTIVQRVLGHKNAATTLRYLQGLAQDDSEVRAALDRVFGKENGNGNDSPSPSGGEQC
jgi:integrase